MLSYIYILMHLYIYMLADLSKIYKINRPVIIIVFILLCTYILTFLYTYIITKLYILTREASLC